MSRAAWTRRTGDPKLLSGVDEMISARSARETMVQDEGGSTQKEKERRKGVSKPK
jgi:hypothetical protein